MTRTGIFGGSFNPPHCGHIALARRVLEQGLADEVWLMVSPHNPLKDEAGLLDERLRLEMARLAVADVTGVEASDFEFGLERPSYTWKTLQALDHAYPDRRFRLIIGSDNWLCFDRWAHGAELAATRDIIVYPRESYDVDEAALQPNVRLLSGLLLPYSSTEVRRRAAAGDDFSGMVPAPLIPYIQQHYGK